MTPVSLHRDLFYRFRAVPFAANREAKLWVVALVGVSIISHASALGGWWLYDDPQLLLHAIKVSAIDALSNPSRYQQLATHTFTPLLPLSFKVDLAIAEVRPGFHYAHQAVALTIGGLLLFALLRRYVAVRFAFCGAAMFLASWPAVYAARTLMIRHYVEGLVFALVALIAFSHRTVRAGETLTRRDRLMLDGAAAFFYFLAMLEKELYAPIPLFFVLQSRANGETWGLTLRRLIAPSLAAVLFLAWRTYMLGSFGGFTDMPSLASLAKLPLMIGRQLAGPGVVWGWMLGAAVLISVAFAIRRMPRGSAATVGVALIVGLLPVVTLAENFEWRYVFAIAVIVASLAALAFDRCAVEARNSEKLAFAFVAAFVVAAQFQQRAYDAMTARSRAEGEYVYEEPSEARHLVATATSWYLAGLAEIRQLEQRPPAPSFSCSTLPLVLDLVKTSSAVEYSERARRFTAVASQSAIESQRNTMTRGVPFKIEFRKRGDVLHWKLDAAPGSTWSFVALPTWAEFPIPSSGERRIPEAYGEQQFRVLVRFPDGRWSITPDLEVPRDGERRVWQNA